MKKTIITMLALLLAGNVQQADAQQRRKTTARKTTTTARRTTTTQQRAATPVRQGPKEVAFYDVKVLDFCVDSRYVYYVEQLPNNAVMKIDRQTGEVSTLIPGVANVYEGRRAYIDRIDIADGKFIVRHGKKGQYWGAVGFILEDGKVQDYDGWEEVVTTNGHYALIKGGDGGTTLFDVRSMKPVPMKFLPSVNVVPSVGGVLKYDGHVPVLDSNGGVWYTYHNYEQGKFGACCVSSTSDAKIFDLSKQSYVAAEGDATYYSHPISWFSGAGQFLYASFKRRIYRLNMLNPTGWEEYAKIPPTLDSTFKLFWPNLKGDILNYDGGSRKSCWFYRAGAFDTPQSLGEWAPIATGMNKFSYEKIYPNLEMISVDLDNNYIMSDGSCITIYNPDGVVGFDKARGKIIKP